jgi:hypothetical protein
LDGKEYRLGLFQSFVVATGISEDNRIFLDLERDPDGKPRPGFPDVLSSLDLLDLKAGMMEIVAHETKRFSNPLGIVEGQI